MLEIPPRRSDAMGGENRKSSNVHAVGGKKQKSSNERDSWLSSITPSSHVAAASTAPSLRTAVVSAATNTDPWSRVVCCNAGVDHGDGDGEECVYGEDNGMWNDDECVDGFRQRATGMSALMVDGNSDGNECVNGRRGRR